MPAARRMPALIEAASMLEPVEARLEPEGFACWTWTWPWEGIWLMGDACPEFAVPEGMEAEGMETAGEEDAGIVWKACISRRVQACLYRGVCIFKPIPLSEHILRYGRAHTLRVHRFNSIYCRVQACLYRGVCILKTIYKTYKHNSQHKPGCPGLLND